MADMERDRSFAGKSSVLPVFVIADASGSMAHETKIDALNIAVRELIDACAMSFDEAPTALAVIAFGEGPARVVLPLTAAPDVKWRDLVPNGDSQIGSAIDLARTMIETHANETPDPMRPMLVLACDGSPTDDWRAALLRLDGSAVADRLALAIGPDADLDMLAEFVKLDNRRVVQAGCERDILDFFRHLPLRPSGAAQPLDDFAPPDPARLA
jgi:uncharacterized protein YegL